MKLNQFVRCIFGSFLVFLSCAQQYECLSHDSTIGLCSNVSRNSVPLSSIVIHKPNNRFMKWFRKTEVRIRFPQVILSFLFIFLVSKIEHGNFQADQILHEMSVRDLLFFANFYDSFLDHCLLLFSSFFFTFPFNFNVCRYFFDQVGEFPYPIMCIHIKDIASNGTGGFAMIEEGGLNYRHARIYFKSQTGSDIRFNVDIYGQPPYGIPPSYGTQQYPNVPGQQLYPNNGVPPVGWIYPSNNLQQQQQQPFVFNRN